MHFAGHSIKKFRELRNYTQEYMAEMLGISQNAYSKIENGRTRLTTDRLKKIAGILEISVFLLLDPHSVIPSPANQSPDIWQEQRKIYEHTIAILQREIEHLRKEKAQLAMMLEKRMRY